MTNHPLILAVLLCLLSPLAWADDPAPVTNPIDPDLLDRLGPDARLIIAGHRPADLRGPGYAPGLTLSLVDVADQPFTQAARVTVAQATEPVYAAQLASPNITQPIRTGDVLFGYLDVRATSDKESGGGQFTGWLQFNGDANRGWDELRKIEGSPGPAWSRRYFSAVARHDFPADSVNLTLHLGVIPQSIDVAAMVLWNLGQDANLDALPTTELTYDGREPDAPWRAQALQRIDEHRKGDLTLRVVDDQGNPVAGAKVRAELVRNAFTFATFVGNDSLVLKDEPDGKKYAEIVTSYFNGVTTPSYGAQTWGWPDPETRARYLRIMDWAREANLRIKAHPIVWSRFDWSPQAWSQLRGNPAALREEIKRYIREIAPLLEQYGAASVDVLNEPTGFQEIDDIIQDPGLRAEWFTVAHEAAPSLQLSVNEHTMLSASGLNRPKQDAFYAIIQDLLDRGAPVHAIGFQGHMGEDFTPPVRIWQILDRFAEFGLPIKITEFDINTQDEHAKADYLRDFALTVMAHPAVDGLTIWGFWRGDHWKPEAAMWTRDWTPLPAAHTWIQLVTETFHTDETATTDADGLATIRGFRGDYRITHEVAGERRETQAVLDGPRVHLELR